MIYNVEKAGYILLGRCGESHARITVEIDISDYIEKWPDGVVTLWHRRHGEGMIYPVAAELQGGHLIWVPSKADTARDGEGEAEVRVTLGDTTVKSKILHTVVEKSLTGQEVDTPEASKDWVDKVLEKVGDMTEVKAEAESIEYGQPAKAEYDKETGTLKLSIPEGKPGKDGQNGSQGPQGPQGEPGKDGTDAEVTAENIQSALGYTPVKDVQIAGTSILADGVANVPVASESAFGAVKVFDWGGTLIDSEKRLCVFPSSTNHISNRQSRTAIVPENLDTAVKAAMCDGKGAAWTSAEQKAARERMGIPGNFELLHSITVGEGGATQVNIPPFPALHHIMALVTLPPIAPFDFFFTSNLDSGLAYIAGMSYGNSNYTVSIRFEVGIEGGIAFARSCGKVKGGGSGTMIGPNNAGQAIFAQSITSAYLYTPSEGKVIPEATKIEIYGVKI